MSDNPIEPDAAQDQDKIRAGRLARLGASAHHASTPGNDQTKLVPSNNQNAIPTSFPKPTPKYSAPASSTVSPPRVAPLSDTIKPKEKVSKASVQIFKLDPNPLAWQNSTIQDVFNITLDSSKARESEYQLVWLKSLFQELKDEGKADPILLGVEDVDRVLIGRLEIDPNSMSDDLDYLPVLASLPSDQTVIEYLIACWKRITTHRAAFANKTHSKDETIFAHALFDKMRDLVISYVGLTIQDPSIFPQPTTKPVGAAEFIPSFLALSSFSPLTTSYNATTSGPLLNLSEIGLLLTDLGRRFPTTEDGLDLILVPFYRLLLFHPSLARPEGLAGGDSEWRAVVNGVGLITGQSKLFASILGTAEDFLGGSDGEIGARELEMSTLIGPLARLGVFEQEWPAIAKTYFDNAQEKTRQDIEGSNSGLRATLGALQGSLWKILDTVVRSGPVGKEAVLQYFAKVINLNLKRGGMQVDYNTVSTDGFLINLQAALLRFAEPFLDVNYTKLDRVEWSYLASGRVNMKDETRINASSEEFKSWADETEKCKSYNFITEIFYLTATLNHFGLMKTIHSEGQLHRGVEERERAIERIEADDTWRGSPVQTRVEQEIQKLKSGIAKIYTQMFAYQVQLLDNTFVSKTLSFMGFQSTWLVRLVDPKKAHPKVMIDLPLPQEPPATFKMVPEFFIEDIAEYYLYVMRQRPDLLDQSAQQELIVLCLTFLTSTWYIKNPFLKAKLIQLLFFGTLGFGRDKSYGILNDQLNSHPLCLKHLMSALTGFYIEIESTGSHTQFYDKFNARRDIAYILVAIWRTPGHRDALKRVSGDVDKFVRFINLMMNDVTFLLDESLTKLVEISTIQKEMDAADWSTKPVRHRQERMGQLQSIEGQATSWLSLGKSTVDLLEKFTRETKAPFMSPEIVDRLAAMLDYNLEALVGPKCRDLKVKNAEKYRFNPRQLLSDIIQIYLNLSTEPEFVRAVAGEMRSYRASLFHNAAMIAKNRALKTDDEIEQLKAFVEKVESTRVTLAAEDDLGEVPDEFLDPLMYTIMRDPVTLPSSKTVIDRSTIKAHLLSDAKDPFNRVPLRIEEVIPNPELKTRIEQFLLEKRQERLKQDGR